LIGKVEKCCWGVGEEGDGKGSQEGSLCSKGEKDCPDQKCRKRGDQSNQCRAWETNGKVVVFKLERLEQRQLSRGKV